MSVICLEDAIDATGAMRGDGHGEACFTGHFGVGSVIEQHGDDLRIAGGEAFDERRRFILGTVIGIGFGTVIEQELHDGRSAGTPRGNHQRRAHVVGPGIYIRAVIEQKAGLLEVGRRPHQGGCVGVVALVGVGAHLEQARQCRHIGIEHGVHERRGAFGTAGVEQGRIGGGGFKKRRQVGSAEGIDHGDCFGIERRQVYFVGEGVGPFGSLIDPGFDGGNLFGTKRTGGRHLGAVFPDQAVIDEAVAAAAGNDAAREGLHHGTSAIEPHAGTLLGWRHGNRRIARGRWAEHRGRSRLWPEPESGPRRCR